MAADLDTVKELVRAKRFFVADQNSEAYARGYLAALDWVQHCIEELLDFDGTSDE